MMTASSVAAAAARQPTHRFLQLYSPVWMAVVGGIVLTKRYEAMSGEDYVTLGATLALPCLFGPAVVAGTIWPDDWSYHFKFNLWIGILGRERCRGAPTMQVLRKSHLSCLAT